MKISYYTPRGDKTVLILVDDCDPFVNLRINGGEIHLTRRECRMLSDALLAAALVKFSGDPFDHSIKDKDGA